MPKPKPPAPKPANDTPAKPASASVWPSAKVGPGGVRFEMPALAAADRWMVMKGSAMGSEHTTDWQHMSLDEAKKLVEAGQYAGYMTIGGKTDGCILCKPGGSILGKANGVPPDYHLHLLRTHGLPPAKFSDKFNCGAALRPGRGEGLADTTPHLTLFHSVSPNDLSQGAMGNCWLISSLAAVAEFPKLLTSLSKQQVLDPEGRYDLKLFHPLKEEWVPVTIDDRFPVNGAELKYGRLSKDGELWPIVFEKAFAKMFGGYEQLDGNSPLIALKALTGAVSDQLLNISKEADGSWKCLTPNFKSLTANAGLRPTPWPFGGGTAKKHPEELFELLEDFDDFSCIMAASASEPAGGGQAIAGHSETRGEDGIVYGHAYSLLNVEDDIAGTGIDLVQLRNPWGTGEMTGGWSDHSPLWDRHPKVRDAVGHVAEDDGTFWLSKEDFFRMFDTVEVCLSAEAVAERQKYRDQQATASAERAKSFVVLPQHGMDAAFTEWRFMSVDEAMELVEGHPHKFAGFITQKGNDQGVFVCTQGGQLMGPENGVPAEWTMYMLTNAEERPAKRARSKRPPGAKKSFRPPNQSFGGVLSGLASARKIGSGRKKVLPGIPSPRSTRQQQQQQASMRDTNWLQSVRQGNDLFYHASASHVPPLRVVVHDRRTYTYRPGR